MTGAVPTWSEIARSLFGAWRLARLDRAGMALFDISITGFRRSFFAAVLVAPIYLYLIAIAPDEEAAAGAEKIDAVWQTIALIVKYLLNWAVFPIAMIFLARLLRLTHHYVGYIIAANWGAVLQMALLAAAATLGLLIGGENSLGSILSLLATVAAIAYQWVIARTALQTTAVVAAALVIIDLLLGLLINAGVASLI